MGFLFWFSNVTLVGKTLSVFAPYDVLHNLYFKLSKNVDQYIAFQTSQKTCLIHGRISLEPVFCLLFIFQRKHQLLFFFEYARLGRMLTGVCKVTKIVKPYSYIQEMSEIRTHTHSIINNKCFCPT